MNIRDAILKTATLFRDLPKSFNYYSTKVPPECGSPGCVIGHIALQMGVPAGMFVHSPQCQSLFGVDHATLYRRLFELTNGRKMWTRDARVASDALRLYADQYHPAEVSKVIVPEAGSWDLIPWQPKQVRTQDDANMAAMRAQTR